MAYLLSRREAAEPQRSQARTLKQIVAKGDGATAMLQAAKAKTKSCADVAKTVAADSSLTAVDLNDVALSGLSDAVRTALQPVQAGGSTDVMTDVTNGNKAVLFVCQRAATGAGMPTREQVRSKLFETEITMMAERYLRDLKRAKRRSTSVARRPSLGVRR